MENKVLNTTYIHEYAQEYTTKVCDIFFRTSPSIDGKQVLHLANVQQINLFVVKALYEAWQREASEFESPYYDYNNPEVKQLLKQLMNSLSKHINIERENFEPLFIKAVEDTLTFAIAPSDYLQGFFEGFDGKIHIEKQFFPLLKYFKVHGKFMKTLLQQLQNEDNKIRPSKALKVAQQKLTEKGLLDDPILTINELSTFLPLKAELLYVDAKKKTVAEPIPSKEMEAQNASDLFLDGEKAQNTQDTDSDFIYQDFGGEEEPALQEEKAERSIPPLPTEPESIIDDESSSNNKLPPVEDVKINEIEEVNKVTQADTPKLDGNEHPEVEGHKDPFDMYQNKRNQNQSQESQPEKKENSSEINDHTTSEDKDTAIPKDKKIIIDNEDEDEISAHENSTYSKLISNMNKGGKAESLRSKIPLNLRFKFQNELFKGDHKLYDEALERLDNCSSYEKAMALVKESYLKKLNWDLSESSTIDFLNLIDNRYS